MKIASFQRNDGTCAWGVTDGTNIVDARDVAPHASRSLMIAIQESTWAEVLALTSNALAEGVGRPLDRNRLLAPFPELRRNVFCLGPNYKDHADESDNSAGAPAEPLYFSKASTTIAPPVHEFPLDDELTRKFDWEVELAVLIGRGGRAIPSESALDHVLGYSVAIDFSARDVQMGRPEGQWFLGKSLDGSFPLGPWVVTPDEIGDPQALDISLTVNGVTKQQSSTSAMLFPVSQIIADLSRYVTLLPGDVISTGTPAGVGDARRPPEYLAAGDTVVASIDRIGTLETTIVSASIPTGRRLPQQNGAVHEHS